MTTENTALRIRQRIAAARPRHWILFISGVLLLAAVATLFHPAIQKRLILKYATPYVERLDIDRIHALPWSLQIDGLDVRADGATVRAESLGIRFCLTSLLWRTVNVKELILHGLQVDLREFTPPPSEPATTPFPGLFASLDTGFDMALGEIDIDGNVEISPTERARIRITGGEVEPNATGKIVLAGQFETSGVDVVDIEGLLELDQLENGRFNAIALDLSAAADVTERKLPEYARLKIVARPTADPPRREVVDSDGESHFEPLPDAVTITLLQTDADKNVRANLDIEARYDGQSGTLDGDYRLNTNDQLAAQYVPDIALPQFAQSARGRFSLDVLSLQGKLGVDSQTAVTQLNRILGEGPRVPVQFTLSNDIALSFSPTTVTVDRFDTRVDNENAEPVIEESIAQSVQIDLADPSAVLAQVAALMHLDIGNILLAWFNAMLPEYDISSGELQGKFEVSSDGEGGISIAPSESLIVDDIRIDTAGETVVDGLRLEMKPRLKWNKAETAIAIDELTVTIGEARLAALKLDAHLPVSDGEDAPINVKISGDLTVDPLVAQPGLQQYVQETEIPDGLSLHFEGSIRKVGNVIRINKIVADLSQADREKILHIGSRQAFSFMLGDDGGTLENPTGELAQITLDGVDLGWLNPFAQPYAIAGRLDSANFSLSADADNTLILEAVSPLRISGVDVVKAGERILRNVGVAVQPTVRYASPTTRIDYRGLHISGGNRRIVAGDGEVTTTAGDGDEPPVFAARGSLRLDLNALAAQPVIAGAMPKDGFDTTLTSAFDYELSQAGAVTEIGALDLNLVHEKNTFLNVKTNTGLKIKPTLVAGESLAQHVIGEVTLAIENLDTATVADLLPGPTLKFDTINGELILRSDGERLFARSEKPLVVENVALSDAEGAALLHPFDLRFAARVETALQTLDATLEEVSLKFRGQDAPSLRGTLEASIEPQHVIPLRRLRANLTGALPSLLDQPAILPGHALTDGVISTSVEVDPDGRIAADTTLDQLASTEPLAVHTITLPLSGHMNVDGNGFDFSMPMIGTGKSGTSNVQTTGEYRPRPGKPALLSLNVSSELFYLNDILATIDGISRPAPAPAETEEAAAKTPVAIDETPDEKAFWDLLPSDSRIEFVFNQVFYSDYVAFNDIRGSADLGDTTLTLNDFSAHFHDSPITFDGGLTFDPEVPEPYTANITGKVQDFDLNQFFTELTPTKKSRVEGLFGVDVAITGTSPNAAQFRNRLLIDLRMNSRDGLFRPIAADSVLMVGASDALGIIGEGLSYLPTGGFGAGAVSRLVNYMAEIDYDSFDIHIKRDTSLDLKIKRFDMLSPHIRMAARGKITHTEGKDIIDSPLDATANLNMTGKGAAILYSMDLLEDEQDKYGYWKGPEIKVSGTFAATESNFAEIVQRASDGTVKGGIVRPLSGLIGNIKHRWFGGDAEVEEAKREVAEPDPAPAATE